MKDQSNRPAFYYWYRQLLCCWMVLLYFISLSGQVPLSLSQAVEKGLRNNFDIQINQINHAIVDRRIKAAKKERLPTVDIYATQGNFIVNDRSPTSFINDFYRDRNFSVGLDGEWLLFDGAQGKLNREQYQLNKEEQETLGQIALETTIYQVLLNYYEALIKQEALKVAEESRTLSLERLQDVRIRVNLGKSSQYDAIRFENAFLLDSIEVIHQKQAVIAANNQLNLAMANDKKRRYRLTDQLTYQTRNFDLTKMLQKLKRQNRALKNQHLSLEFVKLNTKAIGKSNLPQVRLNAGLSQRFNGTNFPETPRIKSNTFQFQFRVSANYNLFDGGRTKRAKQESELQEQVEILKAAQLETRLEQELIGAIDNYNRKKEVLRVTDKLLKNIERNIQLEQDRYKNGFSSALDFRTVQLEYVNTKFVRLEAIYELVVNELNILQLTGDLTSNWNKH